VVHKTALYNPHSSTISIPVCRPIRIVEPSADTVLDTDIDIVSGQVEKSVRAGNILEVTGVSKDFDSGVKPNRKWDLQTGIHAIFA